MRIGELARRTSTTVRALRYYEEQGLLTPARTAGAHRVFTEDAVARVTLLKQLYAAGLNSRTIAALLPCVEAPSREVTHASLALMREERGRLDAQIAELETARDHLSYVIDAAQSYLSEQAAS